MRDINILRYVRNKINNKVTICSGSSKKLIMACRRYVVFLFLGIEAIIDTLPPVTKYSSNPF
jgi:hypothetical protein